MLTDVIPVSAQETRSKTCVTVPGASQLCCWSVFPRARPKSAGPKRRDRPAQSSLAAADWKKNLATGPNGPIPAIVVDQFGYLTKIKEGCRHTHA